VPKTTTDKTDPAGAAPKFRVGQRVRLNGFNADPKKLSLLLEDQKVGKVRSIEYAFDNPGAQYLVQFDSEAQAFFFESELQGLPDAAP